jgi:hypothetical protein
MFAFLVLVEAIGYLSIGVALTGMVERYGKADFGQGTLATMFRGVVVFFWPVLMFYVVVFGLFYSFGALAKWLAN